MSHTFRTGLLALLLCPPAQGVTIRVPADQPTIQAAVVAAGAGDQILISSGSYHESVVVDGKTNLLIKGSRKSRIDGLGVGIPLTLTGCSAVTVTGLQLLNAANTALLVVGCDDVVLAKLTIRGSTGDGIRIEGGSGARVEKNTILDVGLDCIGVGGIPAASNALVTGNKAIACGQNGMDVLGAGHQVTKNSVTGTGNNGVTLRGTVGLASGNKITSALADGMTADNGSSMNTFVKNKVANSGDDGIDVTGTGNTFIGNKVSVSGDDAFEVIGANNTFIKNKLGPAADDCFDVESSGNLFEANSGSGCFEGFEISADGNELVANKITRGMGNCFDIISNGNSFTGNKASRCADGFEVAGTGNTFTGNKASGNLDDDLRDFNAEGVNTYLDNKFKTVTFGPASIP